MEPVRSWWSPPRSAQNEAALVAKAAYVLRGNDNGTMVTASPRLYPHMWSWDTAFISIGLAHLDIRRAAAELETLLAAQWSDGMLPHIVFSDDAHYFPGPDRWGTAVAAQKPDHVQTSGICQPPVHAIALRTILDAARRAPRPDQVAVERFAARAWPALYAWHRWLSEYRRDQDSGLISIVHGWESGMDNSPRWDGPYEAVEPGPDLPPYVRRDLRAVGDAGQRPTDLEYDRYLWLVEEMRRVRYDPAEVVRTSSFLVGDVFITAVYALSSAVLAELGEELGRPAEEVDYLLECARRARAAVASSCDSAGFAQDLDLRTGQWLHSRTVAGFAPLLCGGLDRAGERILLSTMDGEDWSGHPGLVAAVPPSVSPNESDFSSSQYWRGPQWPVVAWLFGWAFARRGWPKRAAMLRSEGLRLVGDGAFGEYYHPFTGEPLGSSGQSWTAAVTIDWVCAQTASHRPT